MHDLETVCPHCKAAQPLITAVVGDDLPKEGDYIMCFACGAFGIFEPAVKGNVRKPSPLELSELARDPDIRRMVLAWAIHG